MSKAVIQPNMLKPELLDALDRYIEEQKEPQESIIMILHKAQTLFGYLPRELQLHISQKTQLPNSKVNGIVSFYSFFVEEPNGKYNVSVCMGTACFVRGAEAVLNEFRNQLNLPKGKKISDDGLFSISDVRCVGACGLAPVVRVNEKIYGHVSAKDVAGIIAKYRAKEAET